MFIAGRSASRLSRCSLIASSKQFRRACWNRATGLLLHILCLQKGTFLSFSKQQSVNMKICTSTDLSFRASTISPASGKAKLKHSSIYRRGRGGWVGLGCGSETNSGLPSSSKTRSLSCRSGILSDSSLSPS